MFFKKKKLLKHNFWKFGFAKVLDEMVFGETHRYFSEKYIVLANEAKNYICYCRLDGRWNTIMKESEFNKILPFLEKDYWNQTLLKQQKEQEELQHRRKTFLQEYQKVIQ